MPWIANAKAYYFPSPNEIKPFVGDIDCSFALLQDLKAGYLIQEPSGGPQGKPSMEFYRHMVKEHSNELKPVFVSKDQIHKIYRITGVTQDAYEKTGDKNR